MVNPSAVPPFAQGQAYKADDGRQITLAREDLGIDFVERPIGRTELYVADELFLCGTGAEVTPVRSVDRRPVGDGAAGPVTKRLSECFEAVVRARVPERADWLTPVW